MDRAINYLGEQSQQNIDSDTSASYPGQQLLYVAHQASTQIQTSPMMQPTQTILGFQQQSNREYDQGNLFNYEPHLINKLGPQLAPISNDENFSRYNVAHNQDHIPQYLDYPMPYQMQSNECNQVPLFENPSRYSHSFQESPSQSQNQFIAQNYDGISYNPYFCPPTTSAPQPAIVGHSGIDNYCYGNDYPNNTFSSHVYRNRNHNQVLRSQNQRSTLINFNPNQVDASIFDSNSAIHCTSNSGMINPPETFLNIDYNCPDSVRTIPAKTLIDQAAPEQKKSLLITTPHDHIHPQQDMTSQSDGGDEFNKFSESNVCTNDSKVAIAPHQMSPNKSQPKTQYAQDQQEGYPSNGNQDCNPVRPSTQGDIDLVENKSISPDWLESISKHLIEHLEKFGICVIDNFLGLQKGGSILTEVKQLFRRGIDEKGELVNNRMSNIGLVGAKGSSNIIRNDRVIWIDGSDEGYPGINYLVQTISSMITNSSRLSLYSNNGLDKVVINKRTRAHISCYPGNGTRYIKHVDNPGGDGRVVTAIYYLNKDWDCQRDGGLLRMFPVGLDQVANIEPLFDRLLFFWSDRRNPHEVLPAYRDRYAITVWYIGGERPDPPASELLN